MRRSLRYPSFSPSLLLVLFCHRSQAFQRTDCISTRHACHRFDGCYFGDRASNPKHESHVVTPTSWHSYCSNTGNRRQTRQTETQTEKNERPTRQTKTGTYQGSTVQHSDVAHGAGVRLRLGRLHSGGRRCHQSRRKGPRVPRVHVSTRRKSSQCRPVGKDPAVAVLHIERGCWHSPSERTNLFALSSRTLITHTAHDFL